MGKYVLPGIILMVIGGGLLAYSLYNVVSTIIKAKKNHNKIVHGKVIRSVNVNDPAYVEAESKKYFETHKNAGMLFKITELLMPDVIDRETDKNGPAYASVVEYEVDGKKYEVLSEKLSEIRQKKGTKQRVSYNPSNPKEAYVLGNYKVIILILIEIIIFGVGIYFAFIK